MSEDDGKLPYEVGDRKPPKATRFKPGQSGNPKGRPKGARSVSTLLAKALTARVTIAENGSRRTISKLEAAIMQLVNKAASGRDRSIQALLELVLRILEPNQPAPVTDSAGREADEVVMRSIVDRLREAALKEMSLPPPGEDGGMSHDDDGEAS